MVSLYITHISLTCTDGCADEPYYILLEELPHHYEEFVDVRVFAM